MSDFSSWLCSWWNIIFLIPLLMGLGLILIELVTGGMETVFGGGPDVDADIDVDVDVDVDSEVPARDISEGPFAFWLSWLGLGVVPLSILIEVSSISFGGTGLLLSAVCHDFTSYIDSISLLVTLPIAFVSMVICTHYLGRGLTLLLGLDAPQTLSRGDLVGLQGVVLTTVTDKIGEVEVRPSKALPTIISARRSGSEDIKRGATVRLVSYDREKRLYQVVVINKEEE